VAARERDVTATLLRAAGDLPGARAGLVPPTLFTFRTPIEVDVWGEDLAQTRRFADGLVAALATRPRLTAVRAVMAPPLPEVRVRYDRDRLARHGLTVDDVAREVRDKLEGRVPARLAVQREGERLDIRVRVAPGDVAGVADLKRLAIARGAGGTPAVMNMTMNMVTSTPAAETRGTRPSDGPATVALGTVADIEVVDGPSEIHHVAGRRAVRVTADVGGLDLRGAADDVRGVLAGLTRPADVDVTLSGQSEEMDASLAGLVLALLLAAFLVYVIMAATFESFRAPLCIMFTVPLGVAGALMGLWASGEPLSVVAAVGVITLTGVVVNNAIVLLDCAGRLHHGGLDVDAALVEAARVRLRPILITTATTVLGLVPMAMPGAEGAEIRVPVAVTLIGGLMLSTFLTLFVIPAAWRLAVAPPRPTKPPI
jgi:HAE1 family hydrophobic/amphiphilic exporter-1